LIFQIFIGRSIIELLNQHPNIKIISIFRSQEADKAWKRIIKTLPDDIGYSEKFYPKEKTLEYQLYKK
jgi:thioester reductase-like protein